MLNFNPLVIAAKNPVAFVSIVALLALSIVVFYQKHQKDDLRDTIIQLNSQIVASEASINQCLTQIDMISKDYNQQLLDKASKSELDRQLLQNRINTLINVSQTETNKIVNEAKIVIESVDWSKETPPPQILEVLNENL